MWSKGPSNLFRRTGSKASSKPASTTSANIKPLNLSKAAATKQNPLTSKPLTSSKSFQQSLPSFGHLPASIQTTFNNWAAEARKTQLSATKAAGNIWQQSWSSYKFTSPTGARQTHYESIRQAIAERYGSLSSTILMILSAVATDAVFWWLAELLLDDGM